jgi:hypothetical protein
MSENKLIEYLNNELALELPPKANEDELRRQLAAHVNDLIIHNFQKLVSVLYRLDVSESKLKYLLQENPDAEASFIIADLIIERQLQKIKSRQQFRQRDNDIDENEKW